VSKTFIASVIAGPRDLEGGDRDVMYEHDRGTTVYVFKRVTVVLIPMTSRHFL
jgi:hypothetical protein